MKEGNCYPNIDLIKTGKHLRKLAEQRDCTVKDIQRQLHLACPQPVYRWFKGQILPSVDHLYALSKMFGIHMEELLLTEDYVAENCRLMEDQNLERRSIKQRILSQKKLLFPMERAKHMYLIFYGAFKWRRPGTAPDTHLSESEESAGSGFRGT